MQALKVTRQQSAGLGPDVDGLCIFDRIGVTSCDAMTLSHDGYGRGLAFVPENSLFGRGPHPDQGTVVCPFGVKNLACLGIGEFQQTHCPCGFQRFLLPQSDNGFRSSTKAACRPTARRRLRVVARRVDSPFLDYFGGAWGMWF